MTCLLSTSKTSVFSLFKYLNVVFHRDLPKTGDYRCLSVLYIPYSRTGSLRSLDTIVLL